MKIVPTDHGFAIVGRPVPRCLCGDPARLDCEHCGRPVCRGCAFVGHSQEPLCLKCCLTLSGMTT